MYPCKIVMKKRVLLKYSQTYNLFVFLFNSTEVKTETLTVFCVLIPVLVDTWPDFGLVRVRPYIENQNGGHYTNKVATIIGHAIFIIFYTQVRRT